MAGNRSSDGVPGGFGGVLASGRRGPPEGRRGRLFDLPARVLLEPVVPAAFRAAITQAAPATGLVGDVVLEIAVGGGSSATRGGASGVPDLGEVAEQDAGVVAGGLESVITLVGGDRVQGDDQVRLPGNASGEPPAAVAAGRTVLAGGGEGEPRVTRVAGRAGRVVAARRIPAGPLPCLRL